MSDMVQRSGRDLKGEKNGNAKLTNSQAADIRKLYATGNVTQRVLSLQFSVSPSTISGIVSDRKYSEAA